MKDLSTKVATSDNYGKSSQHLKHIKAPTFRQRKTCDAMVLISQVPPIKKGIIDV
jgi:hypothetical protein